MTKDKRIERVREIEARRAEAAARECEAISADLVTIGFKPRDDCPPIGHPLSAATREERGKELVVRLNDVVERVGEVASARARCRAL